MFSGDALPHTVEALSDEFFAACDEVLTCRAYGLPPEMPPDEV